jgi:hypothetical protein
MLNVTVDSVWLAMLIGLFGLIARAGNPANKAALTNSVFLMMFVVFPEYFSKDALIRPIIEELAIQNVASCQQITCVILAIDLIYAVCFPD